jgi:hypothetical protein
MADDATIMRPFNENSHGITVCLKAAEMPRSLYTAGEPRQGFNAGA